MRNPRFRWILFWISLLISIIGFGGWRAAVQQYKEETRGIELATRQAEMPLKLPLLGVNVELTQYIENGNIDEQLTRIADLNFHWLRQPFLWSEIEPEPGIYDWDAYDAIIDAVTAFNDRLEIVALLDGTPEWARHRDAPGHPFAPPESPAALARLRRLLRSVTAIQSIVIKSGTNLILRNTGEI